jgi:hypothetical protein
MGILLSFIYFIFAIIVLNVSCVTCQNQDPLHSNQKVRLKLVKILLKYQIISQETFVSPNNYGRFVRYVNHHDRKTESSHQDAKAKSIQESEKDDEGCEKIKEDAGSMVKHFNFIKSWLHHENHHDGDTESSLKNTEDIHETENNDIVEDEETEDEVSSDAESFDDVETDDHAKVVRSADSGLLDREECEDNGNCKSGGSNGQDRAFGSMDSVSRNSKKTSNIALKAAQEAKAAEDAQETAGKEASKQAKFQLAEKAIQAAKAAQAALSAKQSINEELERELRESEVVVQDLSSSIQQSEANANAGLKENY